MSRLRRYQTIGNTYFITTKTFKNARLLCNDFRIIENAIAKVRNRTGFDLQAWVVLPDHLHMVFSTLDASVSEVIKRVKQSFAMSYLNATDKKSGRVWQHRFWDRIIRTQEEWNATVNYIHYNPVKHGYCRMPRDWQQSSFRQFVHAGQYAEDWTVASGDWTPADLGE